MNRNLAYIKDHFIEQADLCHRTHISPEKLADLIERKLLPGPSYTIKIETTITSPLDDIHSFQCTEHYFAKNTVLLVLLHENLGSDVNAREAFRDRLLQQLVNHPDRSWAYNGLFNAAGIDMDRFEAAATDEWTHFCKGIYGICTIHATEEEIIRKEIVIKKLMAFNEENADKELDPGEKQVLSNLAKEFDSVASLFAPYQRAASSRGRYLDKILKQNGMDELIRGYGS